MKNTRNFARIAAVLMSLALLLGMIPAFATSAVSPDTTEKLLIDLRDANAPSELFQRHTSKIQHEDAFSGGELFYSSDLYATAESLYYFFGDDYVCFITPTCWFDYFTDDDVSAVLMPPEENAEELLIYQSYIDFPDAEKLIGREEQGDELLITTKMTDADAIRAYLALKQGVFGDGYQTDYGDIAEIGYQYRVDAADLTVKELIETLRLADGSELPLTHVTFSYDGAVPDPAAPDGVLASAFDESAGTKQITVFFAPGAPEEQTCQYTLPVELPVYVQYQGKIVDMYEDAACTQLCEGRGDRTALTVYVKGDE